MADSINQVTEAALASALEISCDGGEDAVVLRPSLTMHHDDRFWAMTRLEADRFAIHVNAGTVKQIRELWQTLWPHGVFIDGDGKRLRSLTGNDGPDRLIHTSMKWLMLHELMHVEMGHFEFMDKAEIVGLASAQPAKSSKVKLPEHLGLDPLVVRHCFEMQADWQASELMLSRYAADEFMPLRVESVAIMAVIALIERQNILAGLAGHEHPSAASRFFTMMAGLFQRWMYERAQLVEGRHTSRVRMHTLPSDEDLRMYLDCLVRPVIDDIIVVATVLELTEFTNELGGDSPLIQDIFTAQFGEDISDATLKSKGDREWARLIVANEELKLAMAQRESG